MSSAGRSPRDDYPDGRAGYLAWRTDQARAHAARVTGFMAEAGYGAEDCDRVARLLRKEGLKRNPETQMLEDVICFVFLRWYFADFAAKHADEDLERIVVRTARKMSPEARGAVLAEFDLGPCTPRPSPWTPLRGRPASGPVDPAGRQPDVFDRAPVEGVGEVQRAVGPSTIAGYDSSWLRPSSALLDRQVPGPSSTTRRSGNVVPPSVETQSVSGARGTPQIASTPPAGSARPSSSSPSSS